MVESEDPANLEINKHRFEKRGAAPDRERERERPRHTYTQSSPSIQQEGR